MRRGLVLVAIGCAVAATPLSGFGQDAKLARGKYLVEDVGRCQECHTPKTETGDFDKARWMKGATLVGVPSTPVADWHQKSPDLRRPVHSGCGGGKTDSPSFCRRQGTLEAAERDRRSPRTC